MKTVLTVAGSDCSGGAGIQADLKTFLANGVYGMSVITSLTAQNTAAVRQVLNVPDDFLSEQLEAVLSDIKPDAVKIGMLTSPEAVEIIAGKLVEYKVRNIVTDTIVKATAGNVFMENETISALKKYLFPISTLITPNIPEAEQLLNFSINTANDKLNAAKKLYELYGCNVLIKGGHGYGNCDDILYAEGKSYIFQSEKIDNKNTHGTGCTLSSACAANLAKGYDLSESVQLAKEYITGAINAKLNLGKGRGPLDHGYNLKSKYINKEDLL
ncbi:MAG: bifunctional hydroxymethylpyrimidine kinase/phosphomethylpyrimidine kinase [Oscillospiraceae bacterium]